MVIPDHEIEEIRDRLAENLKPQTIYLFGSYADGTYTDESDFDFYIVVSDEAGNLADLTAKAYSAIGYNRSRPKTLENKGFLGNSRARKNRRGSSVRKIRDA